MSDLPSTDFDNEIELTIGVDIIPGQDFDVSGDDLILGEVSGANDSALNTLNGSDQIDAEDGVDTLRVAASGVGPDDGDGGNDPIVIGNFTLKNTEVFEVRSTADELEFNLAFAEGVETLWFNQNFGDWTAFSAVQDPADIVVTGGDADLYVDYANGVSPSSQSVLVDGAESWLGVNYEDMNGEIENVSIHSQGTASELDLFVYGQTSWTITGDADLEIDHYTYGSSDPDLMTIDATAFTGDLDLDANVGNNGTAETATVNTAGGADYLDLDGDYYSDVFIKSRAGNDTVEADDFHDAFVRLGAGKDEATIGDHYGSGIHGDVNLNSGDGADTVEVYNSGDLLAVMGNGKDSLDMDVGGDATVNAGQGKDTVTGSVSGDLDVDLGDNANYVDVYAGNISNLTALQGNDTVYADVYYDANIDVGDGNNYIDLDFGMSIYHDEATVVAGSGNDTLIAASDTDTVSAGDELFAVLGAGNDYADVRGMSTTSASIKFGGGDDRLETGYRGVVSSDFYNFGSGNDSVYVDNLEIVNDSGDFSGVKAGTLENLYFSEGSGSVTFDGGTTGANAAGIMNYFWDSNDVNYDYTMQNLSDGVTLNMSSYHPYYANQNVERPDLSVDLATVGTATVNIAGRGYSGWAGDGFQRVSVSDVDTLNINTSDARDHSGWGIPTIHFGYDGFDDIDGDLTTLKLSGNAHLNLGSPAQGEGDGVSAVNLATIAGGNMTGNISMKLTDVADGIEVTTGSGNDWIRGIEEGSSYDVTTGSGSDTIKTVDGDDTIDAGANNDTVSSGAGIDNIDLGSGDDLAMFAAGELTDADTIDGGDGAGDVVKMTHGGLGTVVDDLFYNWSGVEHLMLSDGFDGLTLKNIANDNGPGEITLGEGDNKVTLGQGFNRELKLNLSTGSSDKIDGTGTTNNQASLKVWGLVDAFNDDTIKGGTSTADELFMTADNGTADFANTGEEPDTSKVRGIEKITVLRGSTGDEDATIITEDGNVASGNVLVVDASALVPVWPTYTPGDLTFDGSRETNGMYDITGGDGNDHITTGTKNDTIDGGKGDDTIVSDVGTDSIDGGDGGDDIMSGNGADTINGGSGDDTIDGGNGADDIDGGGNNDIITAGGKADTVDGGTGNDTITGEGGADDLTGGLGNDNFVYYNVDHSKGANNSIDTINDFGQVPGDDDRIDLNGIGDWEFVGSKADFGSAQGQLTGTVGEVVFQEDNDTLWMDADGNGILNGLDLQIKLTGVDSMSIDDFVAPPPPPMV